ncbi:malonyl-ACP O-methyltransferase BioC [Microbulbifer aggregans]|uniref:malonyl-ACP O-methyltransferase BioC n=1 Tax=Microbulbifer aggregans TaxID=1769779 RepID=UPI001CFD5C42|nr:malonyl-ACP O-methyltransferase BioC [Microbulbifer aggregans]
MSLQIDHIVFLHGWGGDSRCWEPLREELAVLPQALHCIDLPGFGCRVGEDWPGTESLLADLEARLPENCLLVGWSLGGMLAVQLAVRSPKIRALATIAANGRFVARDGWPGMAPDVFTQFCSAQRSEPEKNWQRFCGLQARGDSAMRSILKTLKSWQPEVMPKSWDTALECLGQLDNRASLAQLPVQSLHIFGAQDALVPVTAAEHIRGLGGKVELVESAGHCPHLSNPKLVAGILQGLLQGREEAPLEKAAVARAFGRAAASYDSAAHLQRAVCRQLLGQADAFGGWEPRRILDLGSGTGYGSELLRRRYPDAEIIALDIAQPMLAYAREHRPHANRYIAADAEQLPLADGTVDLVFSSFALQWCYRLPQLFAEIRRVTAPGGRALVSTLGPDTLHELKDSWARVDDGVHVNRFLPAEDWHGAARGSGLAGTLEREMRVLHFDSVTALMRELKSIGAQNVNRGAGKGLLSRARLRQLADAYDRFRVKAGLPASYEVLYLQLARESVAGVAGSVETEVAGSAPAAERRAVD